jgi:hypothetical protein
LGDVTRYAGIQWSEYLTDNSIENIETNTTVSLHGADGTIFNSKDPPRGPLHRWNSRYHPFEEFAWERRSGSSSLLQVLSNLTELRLKLEIGINDASRDEAYVDNVRLVYTGCEQPWIAVAPENLSVEFQDDVTFAVTAFGTYPIYYQWFFRGDTYPRRDESLAGFDRRSSR